MTPPMSSLVHVRPLVSRRHFAARRKKPAQSPPVMTTRPAPTPNPLADSSSLSWPFCCRSVKRCAYSCSVRRALVRVRHRYERAPSCARFRTARMRLVRRRQSSSRGDTTPKTHFTARDLGRAPSSRSGSARVHPTAFHRRFRWRSLFVRWSGTCARLQAFHHAAPSSALRWAILVPAIHSSPVKVVPVVNETRRGLEVAGSF